MKNLIILLAFLGFIGISCTQQKPEDVVIQFYNYLNSNNFDKAKELATPSAIEYIDKLAEITKDFPTGDTIPMELMDVHKKEKPMEGDTAIVNYKFRKYKSSVMLVWINGCYKVTYTKQLQTLKIITVNSMKLIEKLAEIGKPKFNALYLHSRFKFKNLLFDGIPYNPETNIAYHRNDKSNTDQADIVNLCNNPVKIEELDSEKSLESYNRTPLKYRIGYDNFFDEEERNKFKSTGVIENKVGYNLYSCTKIFSLEGVLTENFGPLSIDQCIVTDVKDCK